MTKARTRKKSVAKAVVTMQDLIDACDEELAGGRCFGTHKNPIGFTP